MSKKDKIIEELIELKGGVKRAEANPFLYTRIQQKIKDSYKPAFIPVKKVAAGLSVLVLLAVLNIGFLISGSGISTVNTINTKTTNTNTEKTTETLPAQVNPYLEFINNQN